MTVACCVRFSTPLLTGGRASPCSVVDPPLLPKWTLTVKKTPPLPLTAVHMAATGLRLSSNAALDGSMRPGLSLSAGPSSTSLASRLAPWFGLCRRTTSGR